MSRRRFDPHADYEAVSTFLREHHRTGSRDGNWLQPVWEYAFTHPWFDASSVDRIGIWEEAGEIVAVVTYELRLGEAFFHVAPGHEHRKPELLAHAERHLTAVAEDGGGRLDVFVNDFDEPFERTVRDAGYAESPHRDRPMSTCDLSRPLLPSALPAGYRLTSLADENDRWKVARLLHRGFDHPGEPDAGAAKDRRGMESSPGFREDLNILAVAPSGDPAAYAGLWFEPTHRYAYVEPVATDPDHRRRGLGRAAVLEGLRRCAALGATVAYVGTDMPFYLSMGFEPQFRARCWSRSDLPD